MAICRVYLCTYRRNHLLSRALNSLLTQTFTDWVCEVHNDDPKDPFPRQLVEEIGDSRISLVEHPENLGPVRTFNLIFRKVEEPFISLLEDDNWWQPEFLEKMIETIKIFPEVNVAWANMRCWQEEKNGDWTDTKRSIWERNNTDLPELYFWPRRQQISGASHSNGAMLIRSRNVSNYAIPDEFPFIGTEAIRERIFHYPILFVPETLANFAITKRTSRSNNRMIEGQVRTLLAASFFKHVPVEEDTLREIWHKARSRTLKSTGNLFFAALVHRECRKLLRYATIGDWIFFIASCLKRPLTSWRTLESISSNQKLWNFLDQQTACKTEEALQRGFKCM